MPFDARQVALLCPAAIAVHDDGDVARQRGFGFCAEMSSLRTHRIELQVTSCKWQVKGKAVGGTLKR
jgi:hypothetical protein